MRYRVIQWATGAMGKTCLRAVLDHPDLELAGLLVYNPEKAGRDAGDIVKRPATGVLATTSIEEILETEADVVLHTPRIQPPYSHHNRNICRLLASGKNVISINGHTYPPYWGPEYAQSLIDACMRGGTTLFGTGLNPGFIVEKLALNVTGLCQRIESIHVTETVEVNQVHNPNYVFDVLGFGTDPGTIDPNDPAWPPAEILNGMYKEVVAFLVRRLGFELSEVVSDHIMHPATTDIIMAAGTIHKGTIGHTHWRWYGMVEGKPFVTLSIHWVMERAHLEQPGINLWTVDIKGLPGVDITVNLKNPKDYPYQTEPEQLALAASVIHSIPGVCSAKPGFFELPAVFPYRARF